MTSRLDIDAACAPRRRPHRGPVLRRISRGDRCPPSIQGTWRAIPERPPDTRGRLREVQCPAAARLPGVGRPEQPLRLGAHMDGSRTAIVSPRPAKSALVVAPVGPCCAGGQANTIDAGPASAVHERVPRSAMHTRLGSHFMLRLGSTDRRQYNLIEPVDAANVPANFSADARAGSRARHGAHGRRPDVAGVRAAACQLRHRSLHAPERRQQLRSRSRRRPRARAACSTAGGAC